MECSRGSTCQSCLFELYALSESAIGFSGGGGDGGGYLKDGGSVRDGGWGSGDDVASDDGGSSVAYSTSWRKG